ncbi:MAG: glycoside hydrolase family 9 protein [Hyphomonas sp.]|nr:glycoside hydrolase family 9 protein [Hyphomonas sp.]
MMGRAATTGSLLAALLLIVQCAGAEVVPKIAPADPTPTLVIDQFGYRPEGEKILIIRTPVRGFDAGTGGEPAKAYDIVNVATGKVAFHGEPQPWRESAVDAGSGDRVAYMDFSPLDAPGSYMIRSSDGAQKSATFRIAGNVYDEVFRAAFRTFFYQRAGYTKAVPYADPRWADGASHMGKGQDTEARSFFAKVDASSARDLHGGWYDAGDFNKYTNWAADNCRTLLLSYTENPHAWGDDFDIPESGNGIPDVLDEVKWGLDWLIRMQNDDGSVLSIVSLDVASPPSAAKGPSFYGPASTSSTRSTAEVFAYAAMVYGATGLPGHREYADELSRRAVAAWNWAEANPDKTFFNNDVRDASIGLGAGQQETDDAGRAAKRLAAAVYLYAITGLDTYRRAAEFEIRESKLMRGEGVTPYDLEAQDAMRVYATLPGISSGLGQKINAELRRAMATRTFWGAIEGEDDPYFAPVMAMRWGSNTVKARTGNLFMDEAKTGLAPAELITVRDVAARYLHYFHGVNPLGKVYLSNMGAYGAENSVDSFYHGWFADGSALWDSVKSSKYGPPPGFLVGGPNPSYSWDKCCPKSCGGPGTRYSCLKAPLAPPTGQPPLKAYRDFNTGWPLNSWEVTENSDSYQVAYLRLLANFVD